MKKLMDMFNGERIKWNLLKPAEKSSVNGNWFSEREYVDAE